VFIFIFIFCSLAVLFVRIGPRVDTFSEPLVHVELFPAGDFFPFWSLGCGLAKVALIVGRVFLPIFGAFFLAFG
jgi:hypothetical protein